MVISSSVREQFFGSAASIAARVIRVESSQTSPLDEATLIERRIGLPWTTAEHERFLEGLERYPSGPWKLIAEVVGTRTTRQTMTHAQKYRQKIGRQLSRKDKGHGKTVASPKPSKKQGLGNQPRRQTKRKQPQKQSPPRDQEAFAYSIVDAEFNAIWEQSLPPQTIRCLSSVLPLPTPLQLPAEPLSCDDSEMLLSLFQESHRINPDGTHHLYNDHDWTLMYTPTPTANV